MNSPAFVVPREQFVSLEFLSWMGENQPSPRTHHARLSFLLGRHAIFHGLRYLGIAAGDEILLPAYICAAAVEAVKATGATPVFFQVRRDCSFDLDDAERRVSSRTRALVVVHYFGFRKSLDQANEFARRYDLFIVEDSAHVLENTFQENGENVADVSIYSWRKFLPTFYGADLVFNRNHGIKNPPGRRVPLSFELRTIKRILDLGSEP